MVIPDRTKAIKIGATVITVGAWVITEGAIMIKVRAILIKIGASVITDRAILIAVRANVIKIRAKGITIGVNGEQKTTIGSQITLDQVKSVLNRDNPCRNVGSMRNHLIEVLAHDHQQTHAAKYF